ncbi:MAG TPA: SDR family oxidoreductase [Thermomicrobiaceae bacterium]|nr:SDR family oxidoreductase [Thermomicrobiaceae bacterium]
MAGRGVLVTGTGGRIGQGIARRFATEGAHVVVSDRTEEDVERAATGVRNRGGTVTPIACDLTSEDDVERLAAQAIAATGGLDVLVNCAGIFPNCPVAEMATYEWDTVYAVNVRAPFLLSRAVARHMLERGRGGSIVNVSSSAGESARTGGSHYCGSKAALNMLTKTMAIELGPSKIRVNAVAPGLVMDEVFQEPFPEGIGSYARALINGIPLRRTGSPDDIANAIFFLCSDEAEWISGEVLGVNGGSMAGRTHLPPSRRS